MAFNVLFEPWKNKQLESVIPFRGLSRFATSLEFQRLVVLLTIWHLKNLKKGDSRGNKCVWKIKSSRLIPFWNKLWYQPFRLRLGRTEFYPQKVGQAKFLRIFCETIFEGIEWMPWRGAGWLRVSSGKLAFRCRVWGRQQRRHRATPFKPLHFSSFKKIIRKNSYRQSQKQQTERLKRPLAGGVRHRFRSDPTYSGRFFKSIFWAKWEQFGDSFLVLDWINGVIH